MARERFPFAHALEGAVARAGFGFLRILPLDWASGLAGFVARSIGPRLGVSNRARTNLRRAMPELSSSDIERIVIGMWDNLGRVVADYPHLGAYRASEDRVAAVGAENFSAQGAQGKRVIFFSGHFGNWEVATVPMKRAGLRIAEVYRAANNPLVDKLINEARGALGRELVPKGSAGARGAIAALREGGHVAMLVDQKMNDGIAVPFFGRDAMTAPALARLALRYDCAVVPVRVERMKGARFRITLEPPLALPQSGDDEADTLELMTRVNAVLERWIRARPDHWFWLHRRWPD